MPMNDTQKRKVKTNLKTLDYLEGTGVISTHKRKLANELFLFISSGGNGHKTLCTIRDQLRWKVDPLELAEKTAFLAVDAAHKELDELENERGFDCTEVLRLPFAGAHESINPARISPQMEEWVDPKLYDATGGMAKTAPAQSGFDGSGAGAWRQPGRVRLCQPNTIAALTSGLTAAIKKLLKDQPADMRLNVFFLAGLAGGTGSGTIVDLPFLTRQIISNSFSARYENTGVSAYLMLPSACGDETDIIKVKKGNRNAYAALKEIDYFMGLQSRGERFQHLYGTFVVDIGENIFDFCTLVEGIADGGVIFGNQDDAARRVVANSILNLISVTEAKAGDKPFLVDSFLSNDAALAHTAVEAQSHLTLPRDANYCYNVIGYASCVVPIDLMTVYVANKVFSKVWEKFEKCGEADSEAAEQFLLDAQLSPQDVKASLRNKKALRDRFEEQADKEFKKKGPYYMVNLMNKLHEVLYDTGKFVNYAASRTKGLFGRTNQDWADTERWYRQLDEKMILPMGSGLYHVYTFVIRELQRLLKKNAGLLTDSREHEDMFRRSFSWSPIDLTGGANATTVVMSYLDDLIPEKEVTRKSEKFVDLLCSKRDEWTQLVPPQGKSQAAFDAAKIIRDFIQEELGQMVNATMESFLVKLYSGDKDAVVPELPPEQDPNGHEPLKTAAQTLVDHLSTAASPLVQSGGGLQLDIFSSNKYLTVPNGCKWLDQHIQNYITSHDLAVSVYRSSAQEEILFYQLYIGVPAWALLWVEQAEKDYEESPHAVGLHMEHGKNGRDWSCFPNLYNQTLFHGVIPTWDLREAGLAVEAAKDLEAARDLGLVVRTNPGFAGTTAEYALYRPAPEAEAAELLAAAELDDSKPCTMEELCGILKDRRIKDARGLEKPAMRREDLKYSGQIMTTTDKPAPADLGERLAERGLRRKMAVWTELKEELPVVEELKALLEAHNAAAAIKVKAGVRKQDFVDCLASGIIKYNKLRQCWNMELGDEKPLGGKLSSRLERDCKEYYAAQVFYALGEDEYESFTDALSGQEDNATDAQLEAIQTRRAEMKAYLKEIRALKKESDELGIAYPMASRDFEEEAGSELAEEIRKFYDWLIKQM